MVRYIISCKWCKFYADAGCLCDLGSQLNTHADRCHDEPLILVTEEDDPGCNDTVFVTRCPNMGIRELSATKEESREGQC